MSIDPRENKPGMTPLIDYSPYKIFNGTQNTIQNLIATYSEWESNIRKTINFPNIGLGKNLTEVMVGKGSFVGKFRTPLFMNFRGGYPINETTNYEWFQAGYFENVDEEIFNEESFCYYAIKPLNFLENATKPLIARLMWLPSQIPEAYPTPKCAIIDLGTVAEMNLKYSNEWMCQKPIYYPKALPAEGEKRINYENSESRRLIKRFSYDTVSNVDIFSYIGFLTYLPGNGSVFGDCLMPIDDYFCSSFHPSVSQAGLNNLEALYGTQQNGALDANLFIHVPDNTYNVGDIIDVPAQSDTRYLSVPSRETFVNLLNDIGIPWTSNVEEAWYESEDDFQEYNPNSSGQDDNTTGGGNGSGDNSSDDITTDRPNFNSLSSGNRYYALSQNELANFSSSVWTSKWYENLDLILNDPSEGIVKLQLFPFNLRNHDSGNVGSNTPIVIGNVTLTDTQGAEISSGYNQMFNLGSMFIEEYFGSFLDYAPHTKIDIWLPYIGFKELDVQLVMNRTLSVEYSVDIASGACSAYIWADSQLLYTYGGSMGVDIPLTSSNSATQSANALVGGLGVAAGVATTVLSGGMGAAVGVGIAASAVANIASNKTHINKGGTASPLNSFYAPQYCYLVIERPIQSLPQNYGGFKGYPSNTTQLLSSCQGYFEVDTIHLDNVVATEEEKNMINQRLKEGVILR